METEFIKYGHTVYEVYCDGKLVCHVRRLEEAKRQAKDYLKHANMKYAVIYKLEGIMQRSDIHGYK